jgi:hypothetical protein
MALHVSAPSRTVAADRKIWFAVILDLFCENCFIGWFVIPIKIVRVTVKTSHTKAKSDWGTLVPRINVENELNLDLYWNNVICTLKLNFIETLLYVQQILHLNYPKRLVCSYFSELRSSVIDSAQDRPMIVKARNVGHAE